MACRVARSPPAAAASARSAGIYPELSSIGGPLRPSGRWARPRPDAAASAALTIAGRCEWRPSGRFKAACALAPPEAGGCCPPPHAHLCNARSAQSPPSVRLPSIPPPLCNQPRPPCGGSGAGQPSTGGAVVLVHPTLSGACRDLWRVLHAPRPTPGACRGSSEATGPISPAGLPVVTLPPRLGGRVRKRCCAAPFAQAAPVLARARGAAGTGKRSSPKPLLAWLALAADLQPHVRARSPWAASPAVTVRCARFKSRRPCSRSAVARTAGDQLAAVVAIRIRSVWC